MVILRFSIIINVQNLKPVFCHHKLVCGKEVRIIVMGKLIRYGVGIALGLVFLVLAGVGANAAGTGLQEGEDQFTSGTVWEISCDTEVKEEADHDSKTVGALSAKSVVILLEDSKEGWCKVENQSYAGYIPVDILQTFGAETVEEMNREFEETQQENIRIVEEYELAQRGEKSHSIWKALIIVFVLAIFGTGIFAAFKRNEED